MGSKPLGISGSRVAAVLGLSPYKSRVEIWAELCEERRPGFAAEAGIVLPPPPDNAAIRWGLAFEDQIIMLAEGRAKDAIGHREESLGFVTEAGCECAVHVDGVYSDGTLHEGKTTAEWTFVDRWGEPGTAKIPREYQAQVQFQMLCARRAGLPTERAIVSVLCWPKRPNEWEDAGVLPTAEHINACEWARVLDQMGFFRQFSVDADPELQRLMIECCDEFWTRHVVPEVSPPAESMDDIRLLFPEPKGTVVADDQAARMAEEYMQINKEWALIDRRKKEIAAGIIAWANPRAEHPIDQDSVEKLIVRDRSGSKLGSYDGRTWRPGRRK